MDGPHLPFDEAAYLAANPDAVEAVEGGAFSSGWAHYLRQGWRTPRPGVPDGLFDCIAAQHAPPDLQTVPPDHLRKRVHGSENANGFVGVGRLAAIAVYLLFGAHRGVTAEDRVLDFGCGCGRVIRHAQALMPQARFFGTDIDPEAIAWCRTHLEAVAQFDTNAALPPTGYPDGFFSHVYGISVFTHLPEDMQSAWLAELHRITRPGALLVLSLHGEGFMPAWRRRLLRLLGNKGFHYHRDRRTEGLPGFYRCAYHTRDYVERHWTRHFDILLFIDRGLAAGQDLVVCRTRANPAAELTKQA